MLVVEPLLESSSSPRLRILNDQFDAPESFGTDPLRYMALKAYAICNRSVLRRTSRREALSVTLRIRNAFDDFKSRFYKSFITISGIAKCVETIVNIDSWVKLSQGSLDLFPDDTSRMA